MFTDHDDVSAYCRKLEAAGVPTDKLLVKGAPHIFFQLPGKITTVQIPIIQLTSRQEAGSSTHVDKRYKGHHVSSN